MTKDILLSFLTALCFGYPFVMACYWMAGGLFFHWFRERYEPNPENPPILDEYPPVSILVPCFNEESQAEETFSALAAIEYPDFEIIAINDGSTDKTGAILESLAKRIPNMKVVHLSENQGKSVALNTGALMARSEIIVGMDGDALLDRHVLTWFVRRFSEDEKIGALTGNPRIRNRGTLLGKLQVGEFSSIVGLIKRTQTVCGTLFTVSGVICAFRKRALQDAGWWSPVTLTDDVEVSWGVEMAGWKIVFEPKAICWILMPETLKGLWRQRLRWAIGGTQTVLAATSKIFCWREFAMIPVWINFVISIVWAYAIIINAAIGLAWFIYDPMHASLSLSSLLPGWWGTVLSVTYLMQSIVSVSLDSKIEKGMYKSLLWIVWYPLVFWFLQAFTAAVALPMALTRSTHAKGKWVSPDRGIR
jgi:poly-beta-1,6-N-acetyl-D-glucosamine synthase